MEILLYGEVAKFENAGNRVEHTQEVIDGTGKVRLESLRSGISLRSFTVSPTSGP